MKKYIFLILLAMCSVCFGGAETVTTAAGLQDAINTNESTPIHLNATSFILTANLTIDYTCVIDNITGADVTIDGNDLKKIILQTDGTANTIAITGTSGAKIILEGMTDGGTAGGIDIYSSGNVLLTNNLTYCDIIKSVGGSNGIGVRANPAGNVTTTLTNCNIYSNDADGVSMISGNSASKIINMKLVNCNVYWNDNVGGLGSGDGGGSGDGATLHTAGQILYIDGGNYYANGKSGISAVGGIIYVNDANFYGNGVVVHTNGDIFAGTAVSGLYVNACNFTGLASANFVGNYGHITLSSNTLLSEITNCTFSAPGTITTDVAAIWAAADTTAIITINGNTFSNLTDDANAFWILDVSNSGTSSSTAATVTFKNNTVYNCKQGLDLRLQNRRYVIANNIFSTMTTAVSNPDSAYYLNAINGHNVFYSVTNTVTGGVLMSTDLTSDPQFVNAAGGDFRTKNANLRINADTYIGANSPVGLKGWLK